MSFLGKESPININGVIPSKTQLDWIADGITVLASSKSSPISIGITNESEIWVIVASDKQPWNFCIDVPEYMISASSASINAGTSAMYPKSENITLTKTTALRHTSSRFIYLGTIPRNSLGETILPTSIADARMYQIPPTQNINCAFYNNSLENATVSIGIIRVWR